MKTKHYSFVAAALLVAFMGSAQNTLDGTNAGSASGTNLVSIGFQTLYACTTCAMRPTIGNSVVGYQAASNLTTSSNYNSMLGYAAGLSASGSNNVYVGRSAGALISGSNNVMIGNLVGSTTGTISNKLFIDNSSTATPTIFGDFTTKKVGIGGFSSFPLTSGGADVSNFRLFVRGGILTEEVRVSANSTWADYVFLPGYELPTLAQVEKQIKENGHLANVPSGKEISANGIGLGQMATIQQEKIEELTLYIIEQNKINEKQGDEIAILKQQVQLLLQSKK